VYKIFSHRDTEILETEVLEVAKINDNYFARSLREPQGTLILFATKNTKDSLRINFVGNSMYHLQIEAKRRFRESRQKRSFADAKHKFKAELSEIIH